jgi:phosphopantothenate---cysteine ligase (CTP)
MRILVTAGNTQTPLDRVRCITNIFSGQTGTRIAVEAARRGHSVHLLTSHPELARPAESESFYGWKVTAFRTFDDLHELMATCVSTGAFDAIIHCAAVSDFQLAGAYAPAEGTVFDGNCAQWDGGPRRGQMVDVSAGKVKSQLPELWLRLVPTPKLVDKIRHPWNFDGILVKFKLEVDVSAAELARIARGSREQSAADVIVANTLEGMDDWALLGQAGSQFTRIPRPELPSRLLETVETLVRPGATADLADDLLGYRQSSAGLLAPLSGSNLIQRLVIQP